MAVSRGGLPVPADFAAPPSPRQLRVWAEADRAARPARLARLRARFAAAFDELGARHGEIAQAVEAAAGKVGEFGGNGK